MQFMEWFYFFFFTAFISLNKICLIYSDFKDFGFFWGGGGGISF